MNSGNHMVDGADRILDAQDWQCPVCGHEGTLKKGHSGRVVCGKCGSEGIPK